MKVAKQRYRKVPIAELRTHPRNPRRGNIGAIRESIEHNDFYGAVVVQRSSGYVLAGNHRLLAAREAGAETLPVIEVDVDDATAERIMLADNRTPELAGYDDEKLLDLLREVGKDDGSLEGTGWTYDDYRALDAEVAAIAAVRPLEEPEEPVRLDRREAGAVELSFGGERLTSFLGNAKRLGQEYGTSEIADTVYECLERAAQNLPS